MVPIGKSFLLPVLALTFCYAGVALGAPAPIERDVEHREISLPTPHEKGDGPCQPVQVGPPGGWCIGKVGELFESYQVREGRLQFWPRGPVALAIQGCAAIDDRLVILDSDLYRKDKLNMLALAEAYGQSIHFKFEQSAEDPTFCYIKHFYRLFD